MSQHSIRILNSRGDQVLTYDPEVAVEVETAQEQFASLVGGHYLVFAAPEKPGEMGQHVVEFDPSVKEYIATPGLAGG